MANTLQRVFRSTKMDGRLRGRYLSYVPLGRYRGGWRVEGEPSAYTGRPEAAGGVCDAAKGGVPNTRVTSTSRRVVILMEAFFGYLIDNDV